MLPHPPTKVKSTHTRKNVTLKQSFPDKGAAVKSTCRTAIKTDCQLGTKSDVTQKNCKKEAKIIDSIKDKERRDSFSKFKLLPAIKVDSRKMIRNGKRSFVSPHPVSSETLQLLEVEDDDVLLDTIKKMRLVTDSVADKTRLTRVTDEVKLNSKLITKEVSSIQAMKDVESYHIQLVIRLPNEHRFQHAFHSSDTLRSIYEYLTSQMKTRINNKKYVLFTNQVPKLELCGLRNTLHSLGIKDKTVLILDSREGLPSGDILCKDVNS